VLEIMTLLHEEALTASHDAWVQTVAGADAAKQAALAAVAGCEAMAEGLPRRQHHYQLGPLEELPTSEVRPMLCGKSVTLVGGLLAASDRTCRTLHGWCPGC
jgi:hypothetical protein